MCRLVKKIQNENGINFIFAMVITILVFSVFIGQALYSDVVTFAASGDQDKLCYAAFLKIREMIINHENFVGVDSGTFNASTEFFLRPNLPGAYLPFYIFAAIATVLPARGMYILFFAAHMLVALYVMQKLCKEYFGLKNGMSMVVAGMYTYLLCVEAWYLSFYLITAWSIILFYLSLDFFYKKSAAKFCMLACAVIFAITTGYVTVSAFMIVAVYIFAIIFICGEKENRKIGSIFRFTMPYILGGMAALPYLLEVFSYVKNVVQSETTLADAVYYKLNLDDVLSILSGFSFIPSSNTEGIGAISLGMITCLVLGYAIVDTTWKRLDAKMCVFVMVNFATWIFILIWSMESETALTGWMYALLPVLGGMHIPNRFLMVISPFLYVSIGIMAREVRWEKYKKSLRNVSIVEIGVLALYVLLNKYGVTLDFIFTNRFILELFFVVLFTVLLYRGSDEEKSKKWAYIIWVFTLVLSGSTYLNDQNTAYVRRDELQKTSLVYNEQARKQFDDFIATTGDKGKEEYRIVGYDSLENVQVYLLANYEWYNQSTYDICNYSGYEMHLSTPHEYAQENPWFDSYDWEYLANTRADYFMTDYVTIENNRELFDRLIDWNKGVGDLGNGRIMVKLYQFIPSVICGTSYVYEDRNSLDNGYFYSHELSNSDITKFETNQNSYYKMSVKADKSSVLVFLPYPNRFYHYYIDGTEQEVEIEDMQAIIRLEKGEHTVEIVYENTLGIIAFYLATAGSAFLVVWSIVLVLKERLFKRREEEK